MDLTGLEAQFRGGTFGELVLRHRSQSSVESCLSACQGIIEQLPVQARPLAETWMDEMNALTNSSELWTQDCGDAFASITSAAVRKLKAADVRFTDDDVFNMFQLIVLNYAYATHRSGHSRAIIEQALWGWHPRQVLSWLLKPVLALGVTAGIAIWGFLAGNPHLWLPYSGAAASVVSLLTQSWVESDRIGALRPASMILKGILAYVRFYATLALLACTGLGFWWIVRQ